MYREVRECVHRSRATCGRLGVGWAAQKWWMEATAAIALWWPPVAQESTTAQTGQASTLKLLNSFLG